MFIVIVIFPVVHIKIHGFVDEFVQLGLAQTGSNHFSSGTFDKVLQSFFVVVRDLVCVDGQRRAKSENRVGNFNSKEDALMFVAKIYYALAVFTQFQYQFQSQRN